MNFTSKSLLALVLAAALAATACSAQWINVALQDLPVLTQMALNIATLVSTMQTGKQATPADTAVIQNISVQASRGLNMLQSLYADYKANPCAATLQKIQNVISGLNQNLPALLESAHISDSILAARVTAATNLILTTVNSFAALMPQSASATSQKAKAVPPPSARDLKKQWNQQICAASGNAAFDAGLTGCAIR